MPFENKIYVFFGRNRLFHRNPCIFTEKKVKIQVIKKCLSFHIALYTIHARDPKRLKSSKLKKNPGDAKFSLNYSNL